VEDVTFMTREKITSKQIELSSFVMTLKFHFFAKYCEQIMHMKDLFENHCIMLCVEWVSHLFTR